MEMTLARVTCPFCWQDLDLAHLAAERDRLMFFDGLVHCSFSVCLFWHQQTRSQMNETCVILEADEETRN